MNDLRLMIVADDLLVRTGLASLLGDQSGVRVVGQSSPQRYAEDSTIYQPDVVVWDLGWQTRTLPVALLADSPLLLLVGDPQSLTAIPLTDVSRAVGVLPRDSHPDEILAALKALALGLVVIAPALLTVWLTAPTATDVLTDPLTGRELDVLKWLAQGLTNKAIALQLGITEHTIKFHVNAIMTKLNAQSRTDAVIRATRAGLVML